MKGYADPIVPYPSEDPIIRTIILTNMFFIGTTIEYAIFKRGVVKRPSNKKLFSTCVKVNLVTFPLTQILAYIINIYLSSYFWFYVLGIEILVIIIEWLLFRIEFNKILMESINSKHILQYTTMANFSSFLLGLLAFVIPTFTFA